MSLPDLIKEFDGYGEYVIWNNVQVDDGYGGLKPSWVPGAHFFATVNLDDSVEMKAAQAQGVTGIYRVVTTKNTRLPWHTVFKSVDGEKTYRVTSRDENAVPFRSALDMRYVSAEDYELSLSGDNNG